MRKAILPVLAFVLLGACTFSQEMGDPREKHLKNIRQLTFGGENAEAYFSGNDSLLVFQSTRDNLGCDQIFTMDITGQNVTMISTGLGRTTCAFFNPVSGDIIYSSTHLADTLCPPPPSMAQGYVWAIYPGYDIFQVSADGENPVRLTGLEGYDAEAVFSPDGRKIAFTSTRDGDLEIYVMDSDGGNVQRVTDHPGYDGGAFFSPDGKKLVFRAQAFKTDEELRDYQNLLAQNLIRPRALELFTINIDGTERRQVTNNGAANFAPYFHPSGEKIIFSSNLGDSLGREFDIYMIDVAGENLEQITFSAEFDGFPMFSYDGTKLVFASNRNNNEPNETNIFIADWAE